MLTINHCMGDISCDRSGLSTMLATKNSISFGTTIIGGGGGELYLGLFAWEDSCRFLENEYILVKCKSSTCALATLALS